MADGLQKLTEYLNQTRRQAELAIDTLSSKVIALEKESASIRSLLAEAESERDYFKNYSEQLKLENSKKWRLQERDDWKSLVESVQKDRSRLQDDCIRLQTLVDESHHHINLLEEENERLRCTVNNRNIEGSQSPESTPDKQQQQLLDDSAAAILYSSVGDGIGMFVACGPSHDSRSSPNAAVSSTSTPTRLSQQQLLLRDHKTDDRISCSPSSSLSSKRLRAELDASNSQLDLLRRHHSAECEQLQQIITGLREEVAALKDSLHAKGKGVDYVVRRQLPSSDSQLNTVESPHHNSNSMQLDLYHAPSYSAYADSSTWFGLLQSLLLPAMRPSKPVHSSRDLLHV